MWINCSFSLWTFKALLGDIKLIFVIPQIHRASSYIFHTSLPSTYFVGFQSRRAKNISPIQFLPYLNPLLSNGRNCLCRWRKLDGGTYIQILSPISQGETLWNKINRWSSHLGWSNYLLAGWCQCNRLYSEDQAANCYCFTGMMKRRVIGGQ